eukprot:TRINITY_DN572_c0_g1_i3.p1 TRINITY_DN572_c0_g1~~TRINITY_DN572_c0_g1_i3.p1  ORF type:complete len:926 (+),score=142.37 TRINITY_DN572_c0_g1_i3:909-3686(+)
MSECYSVSGVDDAAEFRHIQHAFETLGVSKELQYDLFRILAAILLLGNLDFCQGNSTLGGQKMADIVESPVFDHICDNLQISKEELKTALTTRSFSPRVGETIRISSPLEVAMCYFARDALAKALYSRIFSWIVEKINQRISFTREETLRIGILDIYGFEVFEENSLEQFCINYCNESLQQLFIDLTLKTEQEEYAKEGIEWESIDYFNNQIIVDLIENKKQGILACLDDVCTLTDATDSVFMTRLNSIFTKHAHFESHATKKEKVLGLTNFRLKHYAGDVIYSTEGFLEKNKDTLFYDLKKAMTMSSVKLLHELFPLSELDERKRPVTLGTQFRGAVNDLISTLKSCQPHYIRCIKPNGSKQADVFEENLVIHQVRYLGLLENIRVRRAGFANRQSFERFIQRYKFTCPSTWPTPTTDLKTTVKTILDHHQVSEDQYRLGKSKIFIRHPSQLFFLEEIREQKLPFVPIIITRWYRGYRARVWYHKLSATRKILAHYRGWKARKAYKRLLSAIMIQKFVRGWKARVLVKRIRAAIVFQKFYRGLTARRLKKNSLAARIIQKYFRGWRARQFKKHSLAAIVFQKYARRRLALRYFIRLRAAVRIQRVMRRIVRRIRLRRNKAAVAIQRIIRGWINRTRFRMIYRRIKQIQQFFRLARNRRYVIQLKESFSQKLNLQNYYGKRLQWPKYLHSFAHCDTLCKRVYKKYWVRRMVGDLSSQQQVFIRRKIAASDIFKGKKSWDLPRQFQGNYLSLPSNPHREVFEAFTSKLPQSDKQIHFSCNMNKYSSTSSLNPRSIILTSTHLFLLTQKTYKHKKDPYPLPAIKSLSLSPYKDRFLVVHFTPPMRDLLLEFDVQGAPDQDEKLSEFVTLFCETYEKLTGARLPVNFSTEIRYNNRRPNPDCLINFTQTGSPIAAFKKGKDANIVSSP